MKIPKYVWQLIALGVVFLTTFLAGEGAKEQLFGAGYSPVTGYSTMTTAYISASDVTIPVASVKDKAGNYISTSNISSSSTVNMYFNLEPGTTREEPVVCTGISGLSLTGCTRGISFQGSSLTGSSTIAQIHNAGSAVVMTNLGVFYGNEFVGTNGTQTVYDVKTFNSYPAVTSTTATPVTGDQLANKYYVDSVGAGGFTSNNVSSTGGLVAITSGTPNCPGAAACVAINASSTGGINKFSSTGAFLVGVSTTANDVSGGYLKYNYSSTNLIAFDAATFLSTSHTFTNTLNLLGSVTSTGRFDVSAPVDPQDATTKTYVDNLISMTSATGTAMSTITAGQAVYLGSTSTILGTNTSANTSTYGFLGVAETAAAGGAVVRYTKPGGINCYQSGLSPGIGYYLNGTAGQIAATPGALNARMGQALTANCIQVEQPMFYATGTATISASGYSTTTVGFYPARVRVVAASCAGSGTTSDVMSWGLTETTSMYFGYIGSTLQHAYDNAHAYIAYDSGGNTAGTIFKNDQQTFSFRSVKGCTSSATLFWEAYNK